MKTHVRVSTAISASVVVVLMSTPNHVIAQSHEGAKNFIEMIAKQVVATIEDPRLTDEQRTGRYGEILDYALDVRLIARTAIGHHIRDITSEQKERYFKNFQRYIIDIYADRFGGHDDARLEVLGDVRNSEFDTLVNAKISGPRMSPRDTVFRVRGSDDGYKIVDVAVDGV
jgi:ABC-type transporter MlaC component